MTATHVRTPPFTPRQTPHASGYTAAELVEGATGAASAVAVGAGILPGFLLTAPGIVLALAPVIAIGALAAVLALATVLAAIPMLLGWRLARRAWRAVPALHVPRMPTLPRRTRPTHGRPAL